MRTFKMSLSNFQIYHTELKVLLLNQKIIFFLVAEEIIAILIF